MQETVYSALNNMKTHFKSIAKALNLAFIMIGCLGLGLTVGYVCDLWINSTPTFMIIGLILGTGLAFFYLFKMN